MAIFGIKPWVNFFEKMSIFRFFKLFGFIAQNYVFSFQNIKKDILLAYIAYKKMLEKWPFLDQNHGLTPLDKCEFFDFLDFLFLQPREAFFRSRISKRTFCWPILPTKRKLEKWPFLDPNHRLTPLEKCQLFQFLNFFLLQAIKAFFRLQNIIKDIFLAYIA